MTAMNLQVCWGDGCCNHDNQHLSRYKGSEMAEVFKSHNQWVSSSELRQSRNVCKVPPNVFLKEKNTLTHKHTHTQTHALHISFGCKKRTKIHLTSVRVSSRDRQKENQPSLPFVSVCTWLFCWGSRYKWVGFGCISYWHILPLRLRNMQFARIRCSLVCLSSE